MSSPVQGASEHRTDHAVCSRARVGFAFCHALVVADQNGSPMATSAPTGLAPSTLDSVYGFPGLSTSGCAARTFSFTPPIGSTLPRRVISPPSTPSTGCPPALPPTGVSPRSTSPAAPATHRPTRVGLSRSVSTSSGRTPSRPVPRSSSSRPRRTVSATSWPPRITPRRLEQLGWFGVLRREHLRRELHTERRQFLRRGR